MKTFSRYQTAVFANIATGSGHTIVQARAGSGKTTTLMEGLKHVPEGLSVVLCAFSNTTAEELEKRVSALGADVAGRVRTGTLHSIGFGAVRAWARGTIKVDRKRVYKLAVDMFGPPPAPVDEDDTYGEDLYEAYVKCVSLCKANLAKTFADVMEVIEDYAFDVPMTPPRAALTEEEILAQESDFGRQVLALLERSKDVKDPIVKDAKGRPQPVTMSCSFDDMVWLPVVLGLRTPRYDRVLIDEMQDLSMAQLELALKLCRDKGRVLGLGDDRQAIFGFAGAGEDGMARIGSRLSAEVLMLPISYRCDQAIVEVAQGYVKDIEAAPGALPGLVQEDVPYAEMLANLRPGDFVLSRNNASLVALAMRLILRGQKVIIKGRDIGENLRAFIRQSRLATVEAFLKYVDRWEQAEVGKRLKKSKRADVSWINDKAAVLRLFCAGLCATKDVMSKIGEFFGDDVDRGDKVVLSTVHKAKGLERERVWLLRDTFLRMRDDQEEVPIEEENLFYVAVTRAMHVLSMVRKPAREEEAS